MLADTLKLIQKQYILCFVGWLREKRSCYFVKIYIFYLKKLEIPYALPTFIPQLFMTYSNIFQKINEN